MKSKQFCCKITGKRRRKNRQEEHCNIALAGLQSQGMQLPRKHWPCQGPQASHLELSLNQNVLGGFSQH